ncbi:MAG: hypothetical protein ABIJ92_05535 [Candidatus Aenigmatarchaeota archaeon]
MKSLIVFAVILIIALVAIFMGTGITGLFIGSRVLPASNVELIVHPPEIGESDSGLITLTIPLTFKNLEDRLVQLPETRITLYDPEFNTLFPIDSDSLDGLFTTMEPEEEKTIRLTYFLASEEINALFVITADRISHQVPIYSQGTPVLLEDVKIDYVVKNPTYAVE